MSVRLFAENSPKRKMIVLGIDGMDHSLLQKYMDEGKMPNFKSLVERGGDFKKLRTSFPPQSPVAWASVAIGGNPGKHGIFDFIHRHSETLIPYLSVSETQKPAKVFKVGKWQIPYSSGSVKNLRKGKAFWEYLCEQDVFTTIGQIPANYPPRCPCEHERLKALSGMGTPDLLGTQGTFSFYSSEKVDLIETIGGGEVFKVEVVEGKVEAKLYGPANPYKNPEALEDEKEIRLQMPFTVWVDEENNVARIDIDGHQILLNQGEFSEWVRIKFKVLPLFQSVTGICRFYLKSCHPHLKLYVSPLNIDPSDPALPISYPPSYANELFKALGFFYTQNMPPNTKALEHRIFSDDEFLAQVKIVFQEEEKRFDFELSRFEEGLLFHYFGVLDQVCHVFWRTIDEEHPLYTKELNDKYGRVIENLYIEFDRIVHHVMKKIDEDTAFIILSDHGFSSFRRSVNLNTILLHHGYMSLVDAVSYAEDEFFANVDWSKTKAYNLGMNAIYINLIGREPEGIVSREDYDKVCGNIRELLLGYIDPKTSRHPIKYVATRNEIYRGPYVEDAPDLIIGYNHGYRSSWETILGKVTEGEVVDNSRAWSGDHTMDFNLVPGVLVLNRKVTKENPSLMDIAPTILYYFGMNKDSRMDGESLL